MDGSAIPIQELFCRQDDPLAGQLVNNGNKYPASFDKPNMVNFIGNYRFSHRYSLSLNVIYSTGRPITLAARCRTCRRRIRIILF